jgi:hypothetical protein
MATMHYRDRVWGMDREVGWEPLLPPRGLDGIEAKGPWVRHGDVVRCEASGAESAHLVFGGHDWRDYELRARVVPEAGGNVQILFRLSEDGVTGYMLDLLLGWQAVAISRIDRASAHPVVKLSVVNHELRRGRGYDIEVAARGCSLTSYVDHVLVNQVTACEHERGRFALTVWNARTAFERPMCRRLA